MRNLQKVLSVSVVLIAAMPAQEMDLPTFSIDESQATIEWKINELKSAEIAEASVTPPKISIAIKSKSKLETRTSPWNLPQPVFQPSEQGSILQCQSLAEKECQEGYDFECVNEERMI